MKVDHCSADSLTMTFIEPYRNNRFCNFLLLILILSGVLLAETGSIIGVVTDQSGKPLTACQVQISGAPIGTTTNTDGHFKLAGLLTGEYDLLVSFIGYRNKTVASVSVLAGKLTKLDTVRLSIGVLEVEGSMVTASRTRKQLKDIPSAATVTGLEQLRNREPKTSAEALREEPGIFIQKTSHGGGSAILRGLSSNRILILVDGIRLNNSTYRLGNHQYLTTVDYHMLSQH